MSRVLLDMSVSLDGFVTGPKGGDDGLHNWYFEPSETDRAVIDELVGDSGAIVMGRRSYDMGDEHDGFVDNPYRVVHFVLTRSVPTQPAKGTTAFVFVTDGLERAYEQAKAAAGDRAVIVSGGAQTARAFLRAGLLDEIQLHIVPRLVGGGLRLFDQPDSPPIELEVTRVVEGKGVTHVKYRVVK